LIGDKWNKAPKAGRKGLEEKINGTDDQLTEGKMYLEKEYQKRQ